METLLIIVLVGVVIVVNQNRQTAIVQRGVETLREDLGKTKVALKKTIRKEDALQPKIVDVSQFIEDTQIQAWNSVVVANNMMELQIVKYLLEERYGVGSVQIEDEYIRNERGGFDLKSYQLSIRS